MAIRLRPIDTQVVAVIGATSGIGRVTARAFAERGARLVVTGRDEAALTALTRELTDDLGADVASIVGDVTDPEHLPAVTELARGRYGRLDTWVHVAGVDVFATFEDTAPEELRRLFDVNLLGVALGAKAAIPALQTAGGGAFIAISSVEADVPLPYQAAYSASKHGVSALLRSIRMELEHAGTPVAITQVQPYGIDTPLFRVAAARVPGAPKPAAPVYAPEVVAELVVHAAEHPSRELFAGGAGWLAAMGQRWFPRASEALMRRLATRLVADGSQTIAPRGSGNLFRPVHLATHGATAERGGYGGRSFSVANRLQMAGSGVWLAVVAGVAGIVALAWRARD